MKYLSLLCLITVLNTVAAHASAGQLACGLISIQNEKQKDTIYSFVITQSTNNTWCYDIFKEKKLLIHQTSIPGIKGNEGFKRKSDAEKVAKLVIEKLKNGEMPPSVNEGELRKMKVL